MNTIRFALVQNPGTDVEERASRITALMEEELSLDLKQTELVGEVNLTACDRLNEVRHKLDRAELRAATRDIIDRQNAQFLEILDHRQWRGYIQMKDEIRRRAGNRGAFGGR